MLITLSAVAQDSVRTLAGRALVTGKQDGSAAEARFNDPAALAADSAGNLYVADSRNHAIRKIAADGSVFTISVSGTAFDTPSGIAISPQGLIVSDSANHVIRRINHDGTTTLIAGIFGQSGFDDGPSSSARFDSPLGIAVATNGVIYVADCGNHTIRAIAPDGAVTTFAGLAGTWGSNDGAGAAARVNGPTGLALDPEGNLFVSDSNNHTIRKISSTGAVTTFAGTPLENGFVNGDRHAAKFFQPAELAFDTHGALYVADSMNHAIRKISPDGQVSTAAGLSQTFGAEDGDNGHARLYNPYGLAFLPSGELAISDSYNQTIRRALPTAEVKISFARPISLQWNSVIGKEYRIEAASESFDAWENVGNSIKATGQTSVVNVAPPAKVSVFRVVVLP
ncbi:MAG TPA: NHL repeat-containing protein [Verrucomicrobiae bacterium]|nr:NHL repeat-containing protein [Verrucomicrobiae bacterium]